MPSVLIQTADAVVAELNDPARTWGQVFTAERSYADWDLELGDEAQEGKLVCDVVPVARMLSELETQGSVIYSPAIDIAFRKKFELKDLRTDNGRLILSAVDELVLLVEEVNEHFNALRLTDFQAAAMDASQPIMVTAVVHKHLKDFKQYTGGIRIPLKASQDI